MEATGENFGDPMRQRFSDALTGRLMEQRTLVLHEALSDGLVARVTEQLAVLSTESRDPVRVLLSLWGREATPGLALHDAFRSAGARVAAVATGRVSGAGIVAFCGADERLCLPGARFRLQEPTGAADGRSLVADAEKTAAERKRMIHLLAEAAGQTAERVERDLEESAAFTAEEAVRYGLAGRIVERAEDVG